jgi:hypothetical protein
LYAFMSGRHEDIVKGMGHEMLYRLTVELADRTAKAMNVSIDGFAMSDFMGLLRHHWHQEQTKGGATPILAYHDLNRSLVVVDAYTKFVLRTQELRRRMRNAI